MEARRSASTYLDDEMFLWLKAEAKRRCCTQAQVIRTALVEMRNHNKVSVSYSDGGVRLDTKVDPE